MSKVLTSQPFADYCVAEGLNSSTLKHFRRSVLHGAWASEQPDEPTHQKLLGRALHERMELGAERFHAAAVDVEGLKPAAYPKTFAKAQAEHPDKIVLAEGWRDAVEAMHDRIMAHPRAGKLARMPHEREVSVFWDDPDIGVPCKARLDCVVPGVGIVDYKTTAGISLHDMERAIDKFAYHMQAAWYMRGANRTFRKMRHPAFLFVFVESSPPHDVVVVDLDAEAIEQGWAECEIAANNWKKWKRGETTGYADHVVTCGLPRWASNPNLRPTAPHLKGDDDE